MAEKNQGSGGGEKRTKAVLSSVGLNQAIRQVVAKTSTKAVLSLSSVGWIGLANR